MSAAGRNKILTQERLKHLLRYDPETGIFTWLVSRGGNSSGSPAGKLDAGGYVRFHIDGRNYRVQRLAFLYMKGEFPIADVDHKNGQRDDNRWENLRSVNRSENRRNSAMSRNNTSGFPGVYWFKNRRKWHARIRGAGKDKHLGYFDTPEEAHAEYARVASELGYSDRHIWGCTHEQ